MRPAINNVHEAISASRRHVPSTWSSSGIIDRKMKDRQILLSRALYAYIQFPSLEQYVLPPAISINLDWMARINNIPLGHPLHFDSLDEYKHYVRDELIKLLINIWVEIESKHQVNSGTAYEVDFIYEHVLRPWHDGQKIIFALRRNINNFELIEIRDELNPHYNYRLALPHIIAELPNLKA